MGRPTPSIPGVVRTLESYRAWRNKGRDKKTIEEKREAVIRGIERGMRGERGAPRLERFDPQQGAPVVRVLYAAHPLPIFGGKPFAVIDPEADREKLWGAVIEQIRAGVYDEQIEAVARKVYRSLKRKRAAVSKAAPGP
jgi:hypothetical protein